MRIFKGKSITNKENRRERKEVEAWGHNHAAWQPEKCTRGHCPVFKYEDAESAANAR